MVYLSVPRKREYGGKGGGKEGHSSYSSSQPGGGGEERGKTSTTLAQRERSLFFSDRNGERGIGKASRSSPMMNQEGRGTRRRRSKTGLPTTCFEKYVGEQKKKRKKKGRTRMDA